MFDFRAHFCHSAPMETCACGFRLPATPRRAKSDFVSVLSVIEQHSIIMAVTGTVAEVSGVRLRLGGHLSRSIRERILSGNYEQDEMRGLSAILAPRDVVMEIGAGIGFLSSHCAKVWVQKTFMRSRQIQSWRRRYGTHTS